MHIVLKDAGKRFQQAWVFRHISYHLKTGEKWGIVGANGSGKTTLLLCLCGFYVLSEGDIVRENTLPIKEKISQAFSFSVCSPGMQLLEELTVLESFKMQWKLSAYGYAISEEEAISRSYLEEFTHTPISKLSSGTRQRVKIAQSVYANTPVLLLDEVLSHLDEKAVLWAESEIETFSQGRLLIVATNSKREIEKCQYVIKLANSRE